jgi:hypothetical protein
MICRNCQTEVDDDLIFCTNCGERLFERQTEAPTVVMNEPVSLPPNNKKTAKPSSNLKWVALIIALIAIPVSIFGVYLLLKAQTNSQVAQNINKPKTPTATPTRKTNSNQNPNTNLSNTNSEKANVNTNVPKPANKTAIMNESVEIEPKSFYDLPFEVKAETAVITGKFKVLQGKNIDGYVYLQEMYDDHFPDPAYKVFSFGGESSPDVKQTLVGGEYVIVFVNNSENKVVLQGDFYLEN